MNKRMSIGEFAKTAGVSERALRFYEQKDLLKPSYVSESGRRYYEDRDFLPLQSIIAFKYLGFSLEEIKELMQQQPSGVRESLAYQKDLMLQKRDHMNRILKAMDQTMAVLDTEPAFDPKICAFLIHNIMNEKEQLDWMKEHFPRSVVDYFMDHYEEKEAEWSLASTRILQQMKLLLQEYPPEADMVQQKVAEFLTLVEDMFGEGFSWNDLAKLEGLDLPESMTSPLLSPFTPEEEQQFAKAADHYLRSKGVVLHGNEE
ncbi:MerR family transcriptional regulator [Paenibacillus turpanensis]|uniref:MerR family transcriptional regulator n=1 Tax=Paenibacillus turpanensis TaxID=2689078 RepID=UPI00140E51CA|nr:MerR family transcriptional regulator [Paenibacillus turpanensis]